MSSPGAVDRRERHLREQTKLPKKLDLIEGELVTRHCPPTVGRMNTRCFARSAG
jgi:hypothetical protein